MSTILETKYSASLDKVYSLNTLSFNAMDCYSFNLGFVNETEFLDNSVTQHVRDKRLLDVSISVFAESIIACWNVKMYNDLFGFIFSSYFRGLLNYQRYPYNPDVTNQVFDQVIENKRRHTYCNGNKEVQIFNIQAGGSHDLVNDYLREIELDTSHTLLYHGTDHECAQAILENGIDLTKGAPNNNLSHRDGFYLTNDYHRASTWGKKDKQFRRPAVLVFRVDNKILETEENQGLDVSDTSSGEKQELYKNIFDLCTNGYKRVKPGFGKQSIETYNFILAPFTKPYKKNPHGLTQVCIRKEDYANKFSTLYNIFCAVFT